MAHIFSPPVVVCTKCKWISAGISVEEAAHRVSVFNQAYMLMSKEDKKAYGRPARLEDYSCLSCQGTEFRPHNPETDKAPRGMTLNLVIYEPLH